MIRTFTVLAFLLLLFSKSAAAQVQFQIDSTQSSVTIGVRLNTPIGSASDSEQTALTGFFEANIGEFDIHITDGTIYLTDSLRFRFKFGGTLSIATVTAAASPSSVHLELIAPGSPADVEGGQFGQGNNEMALRGVLYLKGDGLASGVSKDPQEIEVLDTLALSGTIAIDSVYRLQIPIAFTGSFDLGSFGTAVVTLSGDVYADAPSTVATESPIDEPEMVSSIYPNPSRGSAHLAMTILTAQHVLVDLYDVQGRRVATVVDAFLLPGRREFTVDGTKLAAGVYLAVISGESMRESIPFVVME